ncbi:MAG TPA: hypothetical protein VNI36_02250 [Candidatus Dormibacteraeota bacterium]|nr:hypothetical protein [Candidatus Dormibacteraeota bacterium]
MKPQDSDASGSKPSVHVCNVCGQPSEQTICDSCAMKIHLEMMARKTQEEHGHAWVKWETPDLTHKHRH